MAGGKEDSVNSLIEIAVDRACGIDETHPLPPPREAEAQALLDVADAAYAWWLLKRPRGWTMRQHGQTPTVNCATDAEAILAGAVSRLRQLRFVPERKGKTA
jgi:hypothetical protein